MSDACGMVATPEKSRAEVNDLLARFHQHLQRNPMLARLYDALPWEQQGTVQSWWMSGYAQGRMER